MLKKSFKKIIFFVAILSSFVTNMNALDYFEKNQEIWFEGMDEVVLEKDEDNKTQKNKKTDEEYIKNIPWNNLENISAEEFQKMLKKTKSIAVMKQTPENMSAYMKLQKFATDKATSFTNKWKLTLIQDPSLEDGANVSKTDRDRRKRNDKKKLDEFFDGLRDKSILVMFYDENDMSSTAMQTTFYKTFNDLHHMKVRMISIQANPSYVEALKLVRYPENWYFYEDKNGSSWRRIGAGVRSVKELEENWKFIHEETTNTLN